MRVLCRAGKNSIGVAILLILGVCNTIVGYLWAAWAILLISKSEANTTALASFEGYVDKSTSNAK